ALNREQRALSGSRVLLLGLAYKRNAGDARESPALVVAQRLLDLGADVRAADPHAGDDHVDARVVRVEATADEIAAADAVLLLVSNHAGAIPSDAPAIMHGIETELGRPVYGLAEHLFKAVPIVGTAWARNGGVAAHPENAYRLLREQQQLALVFPEGTKATGK